MTREKFVLRADAHLELEREITPAIYTEELFRTGNDVDNRAAVKAVKQDDLNLVGMAFRAPKKTVDKVLDGLKLHG